MNTYTLSFEVVDWELKYFVRFTDSAGEVQKVEICEEIYIVLDHFRKKEDNLARQDRNHIEQSDLMDEALYERAIHKPKSVEEVVLERLLWEELRQAIAELSETQARRLLLYHSGFTYQEIADIEGCTRFPIMRSVAQAEEKIRRKIKFLEK